MKTLIVGDTHAWWGDLMRLCDEGNVSTVLQVGDFGYWPRDHNVRKMLEKTSMPCVSIHFCDGNHEDHPALLDLRWEGASGPRPRGAEAPAPTWHRVANNVYWQDRGSTITLPDGRVVLFAGGAWSIDHSVRKDGVSWFREAELLTTEDFARFPDCRVDIVISHTAPLSFGLFPPSPDLPRAFLEGFKKGVDPDPSRTVLEMVLEKYRPALWFFGHYHRRISGRVGGCEWHGLDVCDGSGNLRDGYFMLEG